MSEDKKTLKNMSEMLLEFKQSKKISKAPPHELSASVDEIQKVLGFKHNDKYGYGYWLKKVKGHSYNEIMGILKEIQGVSSKYNIGGLLTNKLKKNKNV